MIQQVKDYSLDEIYLKKAVEERRVYLNTEIDRESILKVKFMIDKIIKIDRLSGKDIKECDPITIVLNTYGGSVHASLDLIAYIKRLQRKNYIINTEVESVAMSGGFFIAITGNCRTCHEYSTLLFHDPRGFICDLVTTEDSKRISQDFEREWQRLKKIVMEHTNIKEETLEYYVGRKEDWTIFPEECIEQDLGIIDKIL